MNDETNRPRFVVCMENTSYPASLEVGKVYLVLPPTPREAGFLRVIDESGEDYLYPARYFVPENIAARTATYYISTLGFVLILAGVFVRIRQNERSAKG